jgi:hypothetical protein
MKAHLLFRDRDVGPAAGPSPAVEALVQDLELDTLFDAMGGGDAFIRDAAVRGVLASLDDPDEIVYRQGVLADCLAHPDVVREIYDLAVEAITREKHVWAGIFGREPQQLLHRSVEVLGIFVELLRRLRAIADANRGAFDSDGFRQFFGMIEGELDDAYLASLAAHGERLEFRGGLQISAELGPGNKGTDYVLRTPPERKRSLLDRVLGERSPYVYTIADRDEAGFHALGELRNRGLALAAGALAQSTDHILSFFVMLRTELAFYLGALTLHQRLALKGEPTCVPRVSPGDRPALSCRGIYDVCLSLAVNERVVGNDVDAAGKALVMITGANRGGKSTFLRAAGLAQLMMQCGMFVGADSFAANLCDGIFTHYRREEDSSMTSGKFDEELGRMATIVDEIRPTSLVLFNESFAATNEREGSEIARQVVRALVDSGVKVLYVTHLYDLAAGFHQERRDDALFLRAERRDDGRRTFRLLEGEPLPTSHGGDVFRRVFGGSPGSAPGVAG